MTKAPENTPTVTDARAMAYRYLANREHSCQELVQKLVRRHVPTDIATMAVDELASENLVDDLRYAESFTRSRVSRFQGPLKIGAELKKRGVVSEHVSIALAAHEDQWVELASQWLERRSTPPYDQKEKARLYRNGGNRGFTHEQMMRALDRVQAVYAKMTEQ